MASRCESLQVGVIGHRLLDSDGLATFVYTKCYEILEALQVESGSVTAISAIAEGADTIFAEAALALGIRLEVVRPFRAYDRDFEAPESRARYSRLRRAAGEKTDVRFSGRDSKAYRKAMQWVVMKSDLVIAVWDGIRRGSVGGTWEAVGLAQDLAIPLVHVDISTRSTRFCADLSEGKPMHRVVTPREVAVAIRGREANDE